MDELTERRHLRERVAALEAAFTETMAAMRALEQAWKDQTTINDQMVAVLKTMQDRIDQMEQSS
jgi:hypothetical protein